MRKDDDDWGQAGTLVRRVMDEAARSRLVSNVVSRRVAEFARIPMAACGCLNSGEFSYERPVPARAPLVRNAGWAKANRKVGKL
jgi:hypothetical protein